MHTRDTGHPVCYVCVSNIIVTAIVLFISTVYIGAAATQAPGDPAQPRLLLVTRSFPAALSGHLTCWLGPANTLLQTFIDQRENKNCFCITAYSSSAEQ